jgi:prevent-host-death family protein
MSYILQFGGNMQRIINLREANQYLSRYIGQLKTGDEVVITKHGKPVARLLPVIEEQALSEDKQAALQRLRARSRKGYHLGGQGVARAELYE